jgi:hypothetical protein
MMGLSVSSSSPTANQAIELLTLLADPEKAAAKIAEFDQAKTDSEAAFAALQKAKQDLQGLHECLAKEHAEREARLTKVEAELDQREDELDERETNHAAKIEADRQVLKLKSDQLDEANAALLAKANDQAAKGQGLAEKEQALAVQKKNADDRAAEARALHEAATADRSDARKLKEDYEARLSQLRKLVIDPVSAGTGRTDAGVR